MIEQDLRSNRKICENSWIPTTAQRFQPSMSHSIYDRTFLRSIFLGVKVQVVFLTGEISPFHGFRLIGLDEVKLTSVLYHKLHF